jgi:DNA polymerase I-like protein with 3'-5' exonuclease and polymerase domains
MDQKAMNKIIKTYWKHPDVIPQAFIHDEIVGEIREDKYDLLQDVANIMMSEMQSVLSSVRIAVEASVSDYWQKADGFWTRQYWKDAK